MKEEIWKDVVGYEDQFKVSNLGRIFSKRTHKILKLYVRENRRITLTVSVRGKHLTFLVHRLVAKAFIPNPENKETVNHKDGNPSNNVLSNLEWATHKENTAHAIATGLTNWDSIRGLNNPQSRFTESDIKYIRDNYKPYDRDFGVRALAVKFNISHPKISRIVNNLSYK